MHRSALFLLAALAGATGTAAAQTAGGPANASPGAMPTQTPLTSSGAVRGAAATPASPAAIGANKPARPLAAHRRPAHRRVAPAPVPDNTVQ